MNKRTEEKRKAAEWRAHWANLAEEHGRRRFAERAGAHWDSIGANSREVDLEAQWRAVYRARVARNDPTWRPTGMLSGGGWAYERYGTAVTKRYFRMLGDRPQRWDVKTQRDNPTVTPRPAKAE